MDSAPVRNVCCTCCTICSSQSTASSCCGSTVTGKVTQDCGCASKKDSKRASCACKTEEGTGLSVATACKTLPKCQSIMFCVIRSAGDMWSGDRKSFG